MLLPPPPATGKLARQLGRKVPAGAREGAGRRRRGARGRAGRAGGGAGALEGSGRKAGRGRGARWAPEGCPEGGRGGRRCALRDPRGRRGIPGQEALGAGARAEGPPPP